MENKIKYSIITPVYNRADCIMRCMVSVSKSMQFLNGGGNIEHVIVDDGSSDATCSIIEEYANNHPYVVFVKFDKNRGTNAARNEAIRKAQGKWCIILDSDDCFCETALSDIDKTIKEKPSFGHYAFAANDMQDYYKNNLIIKGTKSKVLSYPDFLNGYVDCDFIHVMQREVLLRHPFNEQLRIYEGLFFLLFYRDVRQVLFTNKVVTIRERQRSDSISRTVIRTNVDVIRKNVLCKELKLQYFEDDMKLLGMSRRLNSEKMTLYENYISLCDYSKACSLEIPCFNGKKAKVLKVVCNLRLGWLYRLLLQSYLLLKYNVFKKKLNV